MCDQTGNNRRTFNRELDVESGQWEEAIRREERSKAIALAKRTFGERKCRAFIRMLEDESYMRLLMKGNHE